jgi:hypothetical protein
METHAKWVLCSLTMFFYVFTEWSFDGLGDNMENAGDAQDAVSCKRMSHPNVCVMQQTFGRKRPRKSGSLGLQGVLALVPFWNRRKLLGGCAPEVPEGCSLV